MTVSPTARFVVVPKYSREEVARLNRVCDEFVSVRGGEIEMENQGQVRNHCLSPSFRCLSWSLHCLLTAFPCHSTAFPCHSTAFPGHPLHFLVIPLPFLIIPLPFLVITLPFLVIPLPFLAIPLPFHCLQSAEPANLLTRPAPSGPCSSSSRCRCIRRSISPWRTRPSSR